MELIAWYESGAVPKDFPPSAREKDSGGVINIIKPDGSIIRYDQSPYPFSIEEKFHAEGSGRDYAIAAMYLGKTAVEAVEIASRFDVSCGMGVDTLTLDSKDSIFMPSRTHDKDEWVKDHIDAGSFDYLKMD